MGGFASRFTGGYAHGFLRKHLKTFFHLKFYTAENTALMSQWVNGLNMNYEKL